ncbi:MAG: NAD(P)H-binding protein [Meiothermus sp.]|nr:NAD(P)H-binding protein [Meiothermus sp.]
MQRVLIIGGRGFIGWHLCRLLRAGEFEVVIGARGATADAEFPVLPIDLEREDLEALRGKLQGFEHVVFAGGKDERVELRGDAYAFFHRENVVPCVKLVQAASQAQVQKVLILGSYFTYFNRQNPGWRMAERHPYVRSRQAQLEESRAAASGQTQVAVLEIPYVFGRAPGMVPIWKPLVEYVRASPLLLYPEGGTAMISVEDVARAAMGALLRARHGDCLPLGGHNHTWREMLEMMASALGKNRRVVSLPYASLYPVGALVQSVFDLTGRKSGLNLRHYMQVQCAQTYLPPSTAEYLGYTPAHIRPAVQQTIEACGSGTRLES